MACRPLALLLIAVAVVAAGAGPATKPAPASRAATQPTVPKTKYTLMYGAVRFVVPSDWTEQNRAEDEKSTQFKSADGKLTLMVTVMPEDLPIPQHNVRFLETMKTQLLNSMRETFKARNQEVLYGPRSETDDRFLLRLHDRIKEGHVTFDEVHLYRAAGLDLLMVTSVVETDDPKEAAPYHVAGEDVCLGIVLGPADKKPPKK